MVGRTQHGVLFDYSRLLSRMRIRGIAQKDLAEQINMNPGTMCRKLRSHTSFTQDEILMIANVLDIVPRDLGIYFFTPYVEITQQ